MGLLGGKSSGGKGGKSVPKAEKKDLQKWAKDVRRNSMRAGRSGGGRSSGKSGWR